MANNSIQDQIAEIWDAIQALRHEVNNTVKNDAGNLSQTVATDELTLTEHSTAIDDIIIAITPTEAN